MHHDDDFIPVKHSIHQAAGARDAFITPPGPEHSITDIFQSNFVIPPDVLFSVDRRGLKVKRKELQWLWW